MRVKDQEILDLKNKKEIDFLSIKYNRVNMSGRTDFEFINYIELVHVLMRKELKIYTQVVVLLTSISVDF